MTNRFGVGAHLAGLVGLIGVLWGFGNVLQGDTWWSRVVLVMVGVQVSLLVARRWHATLAPLAGGLALGLLVVWVFVPGSTVAGIPTATTLQALRQQLSLAIAVVAEEQAPLIPPEPLLTGMAVGFGLLVIVVDALVRSRRLGVWGVGAVFMVGLAIASLIVGANPPLPAFVVTAAGWLALVVARSSAPSPSRVVLATAMGATALIAGVFAPSVVAADLTPAASTWGRAPVDIFGRGINPMLRLGENLRRGDSVEVLRSITSAEEAPYLKVATLVDVEGDTWEPIVNADGLPVEQPLDGLDPAIESTAEEISIAVDDLDSTMLPMPYPAEGVRGLVGTWFWHPVGGTVRSRTDTTRGQTYVADYVEITPDAGQMRERQALLPAPLTRRYLTLPPDTPPRIAAVARSQTAGLTNDYDRIVALQDWMRADFSYSESSPVAEGYDGSGVEVIERFLLEEQSGYCVHFSSALAVMARSLGIPARIAVGYAPGDPAGRTAEGERIYSTSSDSLHAWTEVYFEGVGWVRFDATPGVGRPTGFDEPRVGGPAPVGDLPNPGTVAGGTPQDPQALTEGEQAVAAGAAANAGGPSRSTLALGAAATAAVLLVLPASARRTRRWWRWRKGRDRTEPLWREIIDTATDLGFALPARATVRGQAEPLQGHAGPGLVAVMESVERERYASTRGPTTVLEEARSSVRSLETSVPAWRRWLARCFPRSLARRAE
ncbi:transglutaminase domain-containing protein [Aeromicrobium phragmitis]|uniref:Transglutaminase domain-containing protein n=1 Tax=Aeromicrobium phragmitis TaxID=2478914 RepID=A0A3L8PMJ3_9ACTN|nr:DUF3488 and transglutaminase-like domain-containing protein [Aeromicrobium phragmitis]RLV56626.1 transglutaminase domain-containing protein [Aeromicrobium phragmitis]